MTVVLQHVAVISLEPWDAVWRRNQHLAARLVRSGAVCRLTFCGPPSRGPVASWSPEPGLEVVTPRRRLPKRAGGLVEAGRRLRRVTGDADVLWVNDPAVGVHVLRSGQPAVYDVTDDWREAEQVPRTRRRLVRAEDALARRAGTVVCSDVLAERWQQRYGVVPPVVQNGVDLQAVAGAVPVALPGPGPHVGYVGTLHAERLDVDLVERVARSPEVGTLHLVGPDALDPGSRRRLEALPSVRLHGPVPAPDVPHWLVALDVLLCPHRVTPFTLSLDAIKAHEYLASGRPVVATPTSGFERLDAAGLSVVPAAGTEAALRAALAGPASFGHRGAVDWDERAAAFAEVLRGAVSGGRRD